MKITLSKGLFWLGILFLLWPLTLAFSTLLDAGLQYDLLALGGFYTLTLFSGLGLILLLVSFILWKPQHYSKLSVLSFALSIFFVLWIILNFGYPLLSSLCSTHTTPVGNDFFCEGTTGSSKLNFVQYFFLSPITISLMIILSIYSLINLVKNPELKGKVFSILALILFVLCLIYSFLLRMALARI